MTTEQIEICKSLGNANFAWGHFDKKFSQMWQQAAIDYPERQMSDIQVENMYYLLYKYQAQCKVAYLKYGHHPLCCKQKPERADD